MARQTLLVILSSLEENNDVLQHFYKVSINEIPDPIPEEIFSSVIYDLPSKELFMTSYADTLVFIISLEEKVAYIGVSRDVFSREWSIELPSSYTWENLEECVKQTSQSLISFN
jgi:hypothetical protein